MKHSAPTSTVLLALAGLATPAMAGPEFCVVCVGPPQTYRCSVAGPGAFGSEPSHPMHCMVQLAREGGHESCSVRRTDGARCEGVPKIYVLKPGQSVVTTPETAPTATTAAAVPVAGAPAPPPTAPPPAEAGNSVPPKTVQELAQRTTTASGEQLKKAGETVGGAAKKAGESVGSAAKKTWNCLTSLFKDC